LKRREEKKREERNEKYRAWGIKEWRILKK